jgi:hypothetical protein
VARRDHAGSGEAGCRDVVALFPILSKYLEPVHQEERSAITVTRVSALGIRITLY